MSARGKGDFPIARATVEQAYPVPFWEPSPTYTGGQLHVVGITMRIELGACTSWYISPMYDRSGYAFPTFEDLTLLGRRSSQLNASPQLRRGQ